MTTSLTLQPRAVQGLTARLRLAVRLLQLSSLDYEQELRELAAKNPFLDVEGSVESRLATDDEDGTATTASQEGDERRADDDGEAPATGSFESPFGEATAERDAESPDPAFDSDDVDTDPDHDRGDPDPTADTGPETDPWLQSASGSRDGAVEGGTSAVDRMTAVGDLRSHLHAQAGLLRLGPRDRALVAAVIESLDDDGYLRAPFAEIALLTDAAPPADMAEIATALRLVQSLEPSGLAARSVAECLRLQLGAAPPACRALAAEIVDGHLEQLAKRDGAGIARALGRPLDDVEAACAAIRALDPRPARRFDAERIAYVVPDVIVRKAGGRWDVQLNPAAVPRLALNQATCDLFQAHRDGTHRELAGHLQEARWAVRNIEQRFSTILGVARSILKHQYGYFEHGPLAMKPLSLGDIAAEVGVHESTVCRVTNNKYMATPAGVIELKTFFSRAMALESGGAASGVAIRELVREMIDDEGGGDALSDGEIARRLGRQGIKITRRTVTKYRGMLQLPAAEQRRRTRSEAASFGVRRAAEEAARG